MRRLMYAPKSYIFIRSSNMGGTVYDVSADVTTGSVTQKLNDLSKTQFTLRNRYRKWIRDKDSGLQIFLPMDMVTIWLQRVAGRPIQVFTGYLDSVPYYQAYPGDAIFQASCTLKKLAFSWFDPGLPFFQQWVMSNDGWFITPDGNAINPTYLTPTQSLDGNTPITDRTKATLSDGGFDELLGRFLVEVAGWASDDVLVSELPKDLPKLAARLYADVNKNTTQDLKVLETALGQVMGINGFSNSDPNALTTSSNVPAQTPAVIQTIAKIRRQSTASNVPLIACALVAYIATNFNPNFEFTANDVKSGVTTTYYGLYAMTSDGVAIPTGPNNFGELTPTIGGVLVTDIVGDIQKATEVFCARLSLDTDLVKAAVASPTLANIQALVEKGLGRSLSTYKVDLQAAFNTVKQYCAAAVVSTTPSSNPTSQVDPGSLAWDDLLKGSKLQPPLTAQEKQVVRDHYQKTKPWLAGILWRAKQIGSKITIVRPLGKIGFTSIALYGPPAALAQFFSSLVDDPSIDKVDTVIDGRHYLLQNGVESNLYSTTQNNNTMVVTQAEAPTSTTTPSTSGGTGTKSGGSTIGDLVTLSANAAFAAQFAFPANYIQSVSLTGNRALMNDVSCLDGAKQFCQAALRTFRSLPDGRFLAFYPDYFGATRKPYWQIYNIEITNFGIQLNDEALATHVYVVGDTFAGDGQINWEDQVSTRGVATITQAFMLNSFIEPYEKTDPKAPLKQPLLGRLQDAYSFLQQYGARPHEEQQPLIRNVFYEFLLAWQRFMQLWASQFATECTFTFQPEVMAGGLIAFPDHSIQMFCDEVTHSWDYSQGFNTQATMSAPSLLANRRKGDHLQWPGFALAGNLNTVGT